VSYQPRKVKPGQCGGPSDPYDEAAFQYLLGVERRRSDRSGRPFFLVLIGSPEDSGEEFRIEPELAVTLFSRLSNCLRETDFMGWYQSGHLAGAVLTELGEGARVDALEIVKRKVSGDLFEGLPSDVAHRLQVRVSRYPKAGAGE
jgi:hypothetical protein